MKAYKSLRHYYWLLTGFVRKHAVLLIVSFIGAFLLIILFLNFFPFLNSVLFQRKEIIGMIGTFSPQNLPRSITTQISNPLIMIDQSGGIQPLLANSWEVLDEGKTYRFHLRNDLFWNDGKKFTAQNINYAFTDVEVKPIDDYTIEFRLQKELNIFPIYLTQPVLKYPLVGIGALYRVESHDIHKNTISSIHLAPNKPDLPYRIYKFYNNEEELINAYKKGDITQFSTTQKSVADLFSSWKNTQIIKTVDYEKIMSLFINTSAGPLSEREVRKALASATPAYNHKGERATGPIPPTSWAYSPDVKEYPFNEEHAAELLDKNLTASDEAKFTMYTFFDYIDVAEDLKRNYESVGLDIDIKVTQRVPQDYDLFLSVWTPPFDPDQYFFWHSTQIESTNITRFNSQKIDKLLEDGRRFLNVKQRQAIYKDFQETIAEEVPAYFMYHPFEYVVKRK